ARWPLMGIAGLDPLHRGLKPEGAEGFRQPFVRLSCLFLGIIMSRLSLRSPHTASMHYREICFAVEVIWASSSTSETCQSCTQAERNLQLNQHAGLPGRGAATALRSKFEMNFQAPANCHTLKSEGAEKFRDGGLRLRTLGFQAGLK
ncbi:unnamed protein product, partial [Symbiodinium sp. KB8]